MHLRTALIVLLPALALVLTAASCSTVKSVPEGYSRLTGNMVNVTNQKEYPEFTENQINSYIVQKPNSYFVKTRTGGWNPFISVYNWDNGKGGGWDRFVHKIGQKPVVLDTSKIEASETNMQRHLEYLGYYESTSRGSIVPKGDKKAYVKYDLTLGNQYPISAVEYDICDPHLAKDYLSDSASFLIRKGVPLSEELLEKESARATQMLKNKGWYDFSQNYFFFEADTNIVRDSSRLKVSIMRHTRNESDRSDITHRKYRFGEVYVYPIYDVLKYRTALTMKVHPKYDTLRYQGINILYSDKRIMRPSVLASMNTIRTGDIYSDVTVNNTYQRYSNIRSFGSVSVDLEKADSTTVDCKIVLLPPKMNGYKLDLEASVNSSGLIGIAPAISYFNRNIFHGGEWLSLSAKGNFQFKFNDPTRATEVGLAGGLSFPTFVFLPDRVFKVVVPRTDVNLTYNYQMRPEYTRNMIGGSFGYTWNTPSQRWMFKGNLAQTNIVSMSNISDDFKKSIATNPSLWESYQSHFELGMGFTANYYSVPGMNPNVSNFKAMFAIDVAGNLLSLFNSAMPTDSVGQHTIWGTPYSQFLRVEGSVTKTWMFGGEKLQALAVRFGGGTGIAYGNSSSLPYERQFWVGGANSMRGWQAKALGPGSAPFNQAFEIPSQTGSIKIEANLEYRFPIVWKIEGAAFFDWGNVWDFGQSGEYSDVYNDFIQLRWDTLLKNSALNTGLGLRLNFSVVVVRFDLGIRLYEPSYFINGDELERVGWKPINSWFAKDGCTFQFGIGYPF